MMHFKGGKQKGQSTNQDRKALQGFAIEKPMKNNEKQRKTYINLIKML